MVQGSLLAFMKLKPTFVRPMVAGASSIQSNTIPASFSTADTPSQWDFEDIDDYGQAHLKVIGKWIRTYQWGKSIY
jgi:hypothetical protein